MSPARPPAGVRLLHELMAREWSGMRLGLGHFRRVLADLGHPERATPAILIGGTNGKGSAAAIAASILTAAGYRTGLYTSPHLLDHRERIRIDGRAIPEAVVAARMRALGPVIARHRSSFFEAMTALAMSHFAHESVAIAVYEVGIGGLKDATNAVDPRVSMVVSVGLDHMDVLGPTLGHIARDKAGIARAGRPFVIGARGRGRRLLAAAARRRGGVPLVLGIDGRYRIEALARDGARFGYASAGRALRGLELGLAGEHQVRNAATTLLGLSALAGFRVGPGVRPGLARVRWPGRLELVRPWLLVDGAHNAEGARALADYLARFFAARQPVLVVGMVQGKRPRAFARALRGAVKDVVVTEPASSRRLGAAELAGEFDRLGFRTRIAAAPARALALARAKAGSRGLVVACGSLYLVGEILRLSGRRSLERL